MPELPEVETIRRELTEQISGKTIAGVCVADQRLIKEPDAASFKKGLRGSRIRSLARRGKALIFELDTGKFLVVHLRIAGWLILGRRQKKARLAIALSDGTWLNYMDQRALGEVRLVADYLSLPFFATLGPEALCLGREEFCRRLSGRKTCIKNLLLNQKFIAGIGNIYAQEALFLAGIRPQRQALSLKAREAASLHAKLRGVLKEAIRHKGSSVDVYRSTDNRKGSMQARLRVYGKKNQDCPVCRKPLSWVVLGGRGTCYCPRCQI